jgi:hypothetical protein
MHREIGGGPAPANLRTPEPESALDVMVVVNVFVVVMVVMSCGAERRAGKHHRKQGGNQKLLHSRNPSMRPSPAERDFRGRELRPYLKWNEVRRGAQSSLQTPASIAIPRKLGVS